MPLRVDVLDASRSRRDGDDEDRDSARAELRLVAVILSRSDADDAGAGGDSFLRSVSFAPPGGRTIMLLAQPSRSTGVRFAAFKNESVSWDVSVIFSSDRSIDIHRVLGASVARLDPSSGTLRSEHPISWERHRSWAASAAPP